MIFRRILLAAIALAVFSAAAAVLVVALAFALFALVEPRLGPAGAAAAGAAVTATLMLVAGVAIVLAGRRKPSKPPAGLVGNVIERAVEFVRQKPVLSASAAIGAGMMAVRNPRYLGAVLRAFLDGRSPPK